MVAIEPSARCRLVLKSVASVTTSELETDFGVIACSSVIAASLPRTTSKVIGSTASATALATSSALVIGRHRCPGDHIFRADPRLPPGSRR